MVIKASRGADLATCDAPSPQSIEIRFGLEHHKLRRHHSRYALIPAGTKKLYIPAASNWQAWASSWKGKGQVRGIAASGCGEFATSVAGEFASLRIAGNWPDSVRRRFKITVVPECLYRESSGFGFMPLKTCHSQNPETLDPRSKASGNDCNLEPPRPSAAIHRDAEQADSPQRMLAANSPATDVANSLRHEPCRPFFGQKKQRFTMDALSIYKRSSWPAARACRCIIFCN